MAGAEPGAAPIDARHAVLCAWVFDHGIDPSRPPPFGFVLERRYADDAAGYLGVLLRARRADGSLEWFLVNRGTRFETHSVSGLLRGLRDDMATNAGIQFGRATVPAVDAALAAASAATAHVAATAVPGLPLLLLGQSMGGGLAHIQAAADWQAQRGAGAAAPRLRFVTFAASDASRVIASRFPRALPAPEIIGVNHVSRRDNMTGPASVFGQARLGRQNVVPDMRGPALTTLGLDFHRADAWVNHCAGRAVNAAAPPAPRSAASWRDVAIACILPGGWPPADPP